MNNIHQLHPTNTTLSRSNFPEYLYRTIDEGTIEIMTRLKNIYTPNDINKDNSGNSVEDSNKSFVTSPTEYFIDGNMDISSKKLRSYSDEFPENVVSTLRCLLCKSKNLLSKSGAHKCRICLVYVHAIQSCSTQRKETRTVEFV